ncbi:acn9 family domain containing protein [Cordyceps fumosorosea ARSEF 2679]|uniref:Succinate dehydrogenase assembly factor 3 n=1 Tax=Cordyceps fumosorosea (strain ARSEF 2679) TaxID=1081104 RepID=A0A167WQ45_CORFA|nr:acn9 family domain containing protein [Cordyceps fumosorosea ARSEF 2679]OAA64069.1 acn9 family domain containing protein [Cordyceps fumosorosea ARSEF 2679]
MRPSLARLAKAASTQKGLRPDPMALLPPIPLYRRLLRAHRKFLPAELRVLGDEYIKAEFRAHRKVDNPAHLIGFLTEWQMYAQKIEGDAWIGDKIDEGKLAKLSDEQVYQLYDLMQSIEKHRRGE